MKETGNCIITLPYDAPAPLRDILSDPNKLSTALDGAHVTLVSVFAAALANTEPHYVHQVVDPYDRDLKNTIYKISEDLADRRTNPRGRVRAGALLKVASTVFSAFGNEVREIAIFTPSKR